MIRQVVLGLACSVGAAALLAASSPPRVKGRRLDVHTRPGYQAGSPR